jgi:hypothetical protein
VLVLEAPGRTVTGGQAKLDTADVTAALAGCVIPGTLLAGGQTFRCPGLTGGLLGAGPHVLSVSLDLSDGTAATASVSWDVRGATEP